MREIELTQNQIALVDDEDFERVNQFKWTTSSNSRDGSVYAGRYNESRVYIGMARFIMNCPEYMIVDHRSHNTLDNRKGSLRICTRSQNMQNSKKQRGTSSIYKGVSWCKDKKKWQAYIRLRDVFDQSYLQHLGFFNIEKTAALSYNEAAKEHFGEFAYLNFP